MLVWVDQPNAWTMWIAAGVLFVLFVLLAIYAVSAGLRRYIHRGSGISEAGSATPQPRTDNPAAFMTASMQAVIQKLREQEKELEALHRREKEHAQQTERLSEEVTRNMPAGLLLVNATGQVSMSNPAAETALGIRSLTYRRYTELLGESSVLAALLTQCLREGRTFRREEIEYSTPTGEFRRLGVTISPIFHGPQEVSGALCLLSDLTELSLLQKQIHMKENLAALGELSAGIAHEFKNALATISGYAQMIRSEAEGELAEHAQHILDQTRSLTHVVTEFLRFARPLELADEQVPLRSLLERVVEELAEPFPDVTMNIEGQFAEISGDEGLLRQALLNLARNAAEAVSGGSVAARVSLRGETEAGTGTELQRISISDNGPGISAEDLPKLFLPFYTTKAQGTGLGLAVVQKIIVQHGGTIEARNHPAGGAEFIVWLPLRRQPMRAVDSISAGI